MTEISDSSKRIAKKTDFLVLVELLNRITSERDKKIFKLLLNKASKTADIEKKVNLSGRRIQQIVSFYSKKELGKKLLPKDVREITIRHFYDETKSISKTKKLSGLKELNEKKVLTEKQISELKAVIKNKQHLLMVELILETGCTLAELVGIKKTDIKGQIIQITGRKTNISEKISKILLGIKTEYVFSSRQSQKISDKRVFQIIKGYAKKVGLKEANPQILRNTHVMNALEVGVSKTEIENKTGVKNLCLNHYGLGGRVKNE